MVSSFLDTAPCYVSPGADASETLAAVAFGFVRPGALHVPIPQLGASPLLETWPAAEGELRFGSVVVEEEREPLETIAREVYGRLIAEVRAAGYPYFVRMWNHIGGINEIDEGRERYQRFCAGRHEAFVEAGYHHDTDLPAASAVGMPGRGLVCYYLAARFPGVQIENPRQVSAYCYPTQYGPKSPSFSRATLWNGTLFVSGTSSVVGHQSVHLGDVEAQLEETLRNIEVVVSRGLPGGTLRNVVAAKSYIRRREDFVLISSRLSAIFPANLYLLSDICRSDLLLEIEAVAR